MAHYFLEEMDFEWNLVRETSSSQVLRAPVPSGTVTASIHYTMPKLCFVLLIVEGEKLTDGQIHSIFDDLSKIVNKRDYYAVIDYTLAYANDVHDGNYSVVDDIKKIFQKTL